MSFEALYHLTLLQPPGTTEAAYRQLSDRVYEDLNLSQIGRKIGGDRHGSHGFERVLRKLPVRIDVSRYRQELLSDLRANDALARELEEEVAACGELLSARYSYSEDLLETVGRLTELELFVERVRGFASLLGKWKERLSSAALLQFEEALREAVDNETFRTLESELPKLRAGLRNRRSLTVGINLDDKMRPKAATLLSINERAFGEKTSLQRVLSRFTPEGAANPLHTNDLPESLRRSDGSAPALSPLFRDLEQMLRSIVRPVAKGLRKYAYIQTQVIADIAAELSLYLGVHQLSRRLAESGFPVCTARLRDFDAGHLPTKIAGLYALSLSDQASSEHVVTNRYDVEAGEALLILTGPNSGGKTTYLRAVAQAQFLAQHGFPVPGEEAEISMVPGMLSLFAAGDEEQNGAEGRLAQELRQLSEMIAQAPAGGLYFFNEAFSSTGTDDALEIAETVLRGIIATGGRVLFATHLHALAGKRQELSNALGEAEVVTLVARTDGQTPTFTIERGEPEGRSYAARLVREFGLDYESLSKRLGGGGQGPGA